MRSLWIIKKLYNISINMIELLNWMKLDRLMEFVVVFVKASYTNFAIKEFKSHLERK